MNDLKERIELLEGYYNDDENGLNKSFLVQRIAELKKSYQYLLENKDTITEIKLR